MIGPGTYIFPNGTQQHGEYIVVEEEAEDDSDTGKGKDGEAENWARTKQVKIKWVSRSGDAQPVTIVRKETMINWLALHALENRPTRTFLCVQNLGANWMHDSQKRYAAQCSCEERFYDGKHRATNSQARSLKWRHPRILRGWMIRRGKTAFNIEVKREPCTECSNTQISMYQHLSFQKGPLNSFSAMQPRQCQSYAAKAWGMNHGRLKQNAKGTNSYSLPTNWLIRKKGSSRRIVELNNRWEAKNYHHSMGWKTSLVSAIFKQKA